MIKHHIETPRSHYKADNPYFHAFSGVLGAGLPTPP
jgi:hypothetical protein